MDFKGINWAGNIYQKFETMCMEVEEVMYQDTVKYMENQVQKVGGSVKKFYSEVMQDLLPMSCVRPVKVAAAAANSKDSSSIPNANTDTEEKEIEDESIFDVKAEKESPKKLPSYSIRSLSKASHGAVAQDKRPELFPVRTKKAGAHKPLGIKRISRTNHSSETRNSSAVKTKGDDSVTLSSGTAVKGKMYTFETPQETPPSDKDLSQETPPSGKDLSAESVRQKRGDPIASENNTSASSAVGETERACAHASYCILAAESDAHTSLSNISVLKSSAGALNVESENDAVTSNEDKLEWRLIGNVKYPREEIPEPTEMSKLEKSCVFIDGNTLTQHIPEGTMKHKSYKQKIQKAFLSKLRSAKMQHQLMPEYKDLGGKKPIRDIMSSEKRALSTDDDALESDWEIL